MKRLKLVFFGSPEEAVPFLEGCASGHEVLAVVTRPDRPAGRGLRLSPPAVKEAALRLGVPVLQPERPSEAAGRLAQLKADLAVVVAYGRILKPDVLAATRLGFMNVHFSLLPKFRGAAPVAWALMNGETETGVTLFWLDEGMDTGPVQETRSLAVGPDEDEPALMERLVALGVTGLVHALGEVAAGRVRREPQAGEPSLAPKLSRRDARVSFAMPAKGLHDRVRGLAGGPRAFVVLRRTGGGETGLSWLKTSLEGTAKTAEATATDPGGKGPGGPFPPGTIHAIVRGKGVLIECLPGRLWLIQVQPDGKRPQPATEFLNGLRLKPGDAIAYAS